MFYNVKSVIETSPPHLPLFFLRGLLSRGAELRRVFLYVDASAAAEKELRRHKIRTYKSFIHHYCGRAFSFSFFGILVLFLFLVNLNRRQCWRRPSSHIWKPLESRFQHLDSSWLWTSSSLSGTWSPWCDRRGSPASTSCLRPTTSLSPGLADSPVASVAGWCRRSGVGGVVVRCLPRGDTGAWPTRI